MTSEESNFWYEELAGQSWATLWHGYVICGHCVGIRQFEADCPACGAKPRPSVSLVNEGEVVQSVWMGAEGRYEDYVYLQMLQREWERPAAVFEGFEHFPEEERPSSRAALVLLFWSYFETRIERLHRTAMRDLPQRVLDDEMKRYSFIGQRLYDLYKIFFDTNYFEDLRDLGFENVANVLKDLHRRRNDFAHGNPSAINDATVKALVEVLKAEHEGWIAVYNRRVQT